MRFLYYEISIKSINRETVRMPKKFLENHKLHVEKVYFVLFKYLILIICNSF